MDLLINLLDAFIRVHRLVTLHYVNNSFNLVIFNIVCVISLYEVNLLALVLQIFLH